MSKAVLSSVLPFAIGACTMVCETHCLALLPGLMIRFPALRVALQGQAARGAGEGGGAAAAAQEAAAGPGAAQVASAADRGGDAAEGDQAAQETGGSGFLDGMGCTKHNWCFRETATAGRGGVAAEGGQAAQETNRFGHLMRWAAENINGGLGRRQQQIDEESHMREVKRLRRQVGIG